MLEDVGYAPQNPHPHLLLSLLQFYDSQPSVSMGMTLGSVGKIFWADIVVVIYGL